MAIIDLIEQKRDGGELSGEQIGWFVQAYTAGEVPDYQAAALMMAIYIRGMNRRETVELTQAMAASGDQLDLHDVLPFVVDKHSSGGVGDKTTLVIQPIVAACGVPVGKMSGRGLGSSGGTLDKMESFPGWSFELTLERFKKQLVETGLVLAGQTGDLAPADGKLYALRDVTGTVASTPLIAASIMSKKLAAGADAIVLDVKMGKGAFMPTVETARELARIMVDIGTDAGRETVGLITDMNQPLGYAVGNVLEVKEAIATLQGNALQGKGPDDFWGHCLDVAGQMLLLAKKADTLEGAKALAVAAVEDGRALDKFRQLVEVQGGDPALVDNTDGLAQAEFVEDIKAEQSGYIAEIDARAIGWSCVRLGGGRQVKEDEIDHAVGMVIPIKVGDKVEKGDLLATIHANDERKLAASREDLLKAVTWSETAVEPLPHLYETVE